MFRKIKKAESSTIHQRWILIASFCLMISIVGVMIFQNISIQKKDSIRLLTEKGAALIRSFEAGTRAGMLEMRWGRGQVQRLLTVTAQQADIDYILVSDFFGRIIAHSDETLIGHIHNTKGLSNIKEVGTRITSGKSGKKTFEVFKKFMPIRKKGTRRPGPCIFFKTFGHPKLKIELDEPDLAIFVGLDMSAIENARKAGTMGIIGTGIILLLSALSAIALLHLFQNYRITRASLSKIKAFSDTLVENIPIGLVALDNEKKIVSINHIAESVLNIDINKTIGKKAENVLPSSLIEQLQLTKDQKIEKEIECELNNGKKIPLEVTCSPLKEIEGKNGYVVIFKDLREIQALRRKIAINQRLASIGRVAGGMAHEIRNPLSSIKGFATYFRDRYADIPKDNKIALIMIQEVERLNRVVSQLLEFTRPVPIKKKDSFLVDIINEALNIVSEPLKKNRIKIKTDFTKHKLTACVDPDRIKQVFLNLFLNSIEAMEDGGVLSISITLENNYIKINICDTGIGIKEEDLSNIFDPYFTTKQSGTGLGLAIVHNIIEAHSGKIEVQTDPGNRTCITLFLTTL